MISEKLVQEESKKMRETDAENDQQTTCTCTCMDMLHKIANLVLGENHEAKKTKVKGKVVLVKKNLLDFNDLGASILDRAHELFGQRISIQFISATHADRRSSDKSLRGKLGKPAILEDWISTITPLEVGESTYEVIFEWDEEIGLPGAFLVKNLHHSEFYLKTLTLEDVPGHGQVHFVCNSWVYPAERYTKDRIFFTNKAYLPGETPELLRPYREEEMVILRGNGTGELKEWDRVYDYALYNDLGDPDDEEKIRPVIGGSSEYPYPRRGRTGRAPTRSDPKTESRLSLIKSLKVYVPRDERFGHLKKSDFLAYGLESILKVLLPEFEALADDTLDEFDSLEDVLKLYDGGIKLPEGPLLDNLLEKIRFQMLKELVRSDGEGLAKYSTPQVIEAEISAWNTDEEFAREMLAGVNPVSIQLLKDFPPTSKLDTEVYGNQNSSIRSHHIVEHLDGLEVEKVLEANRLFILDHHDSLMPYVKRINATSTKIYATRTLLLLQKDGTLKPIAIELSLPHPDDEKLGAINEVYTPAKDGVEAATWQLAKTYVAVNDSGVHQLISHWLNTHAVIEPFVIATNRQLSVLHPINKLLHPHFRDTMNINAAARNILINSKGVLERTFFPGKYSIEMSSKIYKNWVFPNQALPVDLVLRGMAVEDPNAPHGLRLLIEDYPFAVDGLEIWSAIKTWVEEYCKFYYRNDNMVENDAELQSWWTELREEGHGDLKDEPWWPKMSSVQDVIDTCTIIIWVSSALHAAVNFGQYPYAGYPPNRPTLSRRLMPKTSEYDELMKDPKKFFLKTITPQLQSLLSVSLIEILSRHTSDEIYLGQRECPEWTMDAEPLHAFEKFGKKLKEIEKRIKDLNEDHERLKNRFGPVKMPYTLLHPSSQEGLTGMGIPNSVSI
ncbi:probable linoleate 9S-lipoxygenase 5 isoform X1 [Cynara cardunculus var. scolymus]|uniref:probable linoleate 9S-lipoxygenase 5 isoform X1 n=1 Tax=Cynara cardunculus var. scolymus TaxID=59895 RepID=UPI000D6267C3|nr:probable linoleate 9S-lipoxygenase 5 isoform X1 [Cynara cardunculus var. scolymus]